MSDTNTGYSWLYQGHSQQGARHKQQQDPCQDAYRIEKTDNIIAMCISDGHGDKKHHYSDRGSKFAVEVTSKILQEAIQSMVEHPDRPKYHEDIFQNTLPQRIAWEWNTLCKKDIHQENPQGTTPCDGAWTEDIVAYGATILGVAMNSEWLVAYQLGDGDIAMVYDNDVQYVFEEDPDMMSTFTHSLCQVCHASYAKIRCIRLQKTPNMIVLSSDGIRDSLQGDRHKYSQLITWLYKKISTDSERTFLEKIPDWLDTISATGNGDDISLVFAIRTKISEAPMEIQQIASENPQIHEEEWE